MKGFYISILLFFFISNGLIAQEIDTIPINTKDLQIKLKHSPLPSRMGSLIFTPLTLPPKVVSAKINYWNTKTSIGINLNQAAFSNNWSGGGVNSMAIAGIINYKTEYRKEDFSYAQEVILNYGKVKNRDQLEKKTVDRIYWDHKVAVQLSKNWYLFGSVNFESQFDKGFSYSRPNNGNEVAALLSRFMSPGYLTESFGFEYKPNKFFSTRIGTGTARQTFVLDTAIHNDKNKNFGVPIGSQIRNELAFQVVTNYDKDIFKNINLKMKYMMFVPYDDIGFTNHRLDVALTAKVNRFMNTSITGVGLYDKNTSSQIQGSQTLSLGLVFIFPR
ncbi:hypothetical protein AAKU52_000774 [Pedobacter sp. CG_S7]|uniref:DUF3078 domain-containing protein n=1 Tax=Pedobacter sp. CG_S7 TaxID=3143930 RepID=UPI0033916BE4